MARVLLDPHVKVRLLPVDSRAIRAIGYDAGAQELHVAFRTSPKIYVYSGVPAEVYERFLTSESKGTFFMAEIRDAYPFRHFVRV